MVSRLLAPLALVVAFAVFPARAFACECGSNTPLWIVSARYEFKSVFVGKVTAIDTSQPTIGPNGEIRLSFRSTTHLSVERQFRGVTAAEVSINGAGGDCDFSFVQGQSYLIYDSAGDGSSVGVCNEPVPLQEASEDLKYIEGTIAKRQQSIIYGEITEQQLAADGKPVVSRSTVDVTIVLNGANGQFQRPYSPSSHFGYQVVVAPGNYRVWLERDGMPVSAPQTIQLQNGSAVRRDLSSNRQ